MKNPKTAKPVMKHILSVFETSLYVADLRRSAGFYMSLFGFTPEAVSDRLIALGVNDNQLLPLCRKKASKDLQKGDHDGDGRLHLAFSVETEALPEWRTTLCDNGIPLEDERSWEFGGHSIYFRDPDGHLIELATSGTWPHY